MRLPRLTRQDSKLLLVAVTCLLIAWTGPAIARGATAQLVNNADKVDGRHAVGPKASLRKARGKLVAHNRKGELPAKFIPKSFMTEKEFERSPGTRLIAAGLVGSTGAADGGNGHVHLGIWSVEKTGPGAYAIRYRAPGLCAGPSWPIIHLTKAFASGEVYNTITFRDCATNVFTTRVQTRNSAGSAADSSFFFSIYGPGETVGPEPAPRTPLVAPRSGGSVAR